MHVKEKNTALVLGWCRHFKCMRRAESLMIFLFSLEKYRRDKGEDELTHINVHRKRMSFAQFFLL